jgi:hypothetical protein
MIDLMKMAQEEATERFRTFNEGDKYEPTLFLTRGESFGKVDVPLNQGPQYIAAMIKLSKADAAVFVASSHGILRAIPVEEQDMLPGPELIAELKAAARESQIKGTGFEVLVAVYCDAEGLHGYFAKIRRKEGKPPRLGKWLDLERVARSDENPAAMGFMGGRTVDAMRVGFIQT